MLVVYFIFGRPFSFFFSPTARGGKVEPQIVGSWRCWLSRPAIQRRPRANHNDIKQSNLQSTKQRKNGRVPQKETAPRSPCFLGGTHMAAAKETIFLRLRHMAGNGCGLNDISLGHLLCQLVSTCMQRSLIAFLHTKRKFIC